jgi:Spy/CpxP family protein refolding chaperone
MSKQLLLALGVLAAGGAALAALPDPDPAAAGPDLERIQQQIGLNDAQLGQLKKVWRDERKGNIKRRADMAIARMEMEELLDAPTVDEKALNAKVKELSDLQASALRARVDSRLALRKVVNPEQQQKLRRLMREQRWHRQDGQRPRGERGPGRGGPPAGDETEDMGGETPGR